MSENDSTSDLVRRILAAQIYDVVLRTPLDRMNGLTRRLGRDVRLKREDLQPVFSFKLRGANNKLRQLSVEELASGVICASAGNHAQGVALSARRLGVRALIVMPTSTPAIKVDAVRHLGGEVILAGDAYDEAYAYARDRATAERLCFVHPFDDLDVIAGQGTIGVEVFQQCTGPVDAIFVPIGGGGLAAGVAAYAKFLRPDVKVIGVEPIEAACMKASIEAGRPIELERVGLFADGVAVKRPGDTTFSYCRTLLDDIITVDTDEICAAIKDIFEDTRVIAEPAGALALAGLKRFAANNPGEGALITVLSGANMNFDRLRYVAERAALGEAREMLIGVRLKEEIGAYRRFVNVLGDRVVTEVNYRYGDPNDAWVLIGLRTATTGARAHVLREIGAAGYEAVDLTGNELAKTHVRYMVGGRSQNLADEIIMRCDFPERPGALRRFLEELGSDWNITLFHYRDDGGEFGRVLVGLQVHPDDEAYLKKRMRDLNYPFEVETNDLAYRLFLRDDGEQAHGARVGRLQRAEAQTLIS
ncbi:MAG: threonine ammonia-lyase, biosynthetic [Hyphomonadaceae bacterium JAD_PAG50586_4]|nr:MAG: threonine ammonia-lyase, biosynthetic [Hyphomonadaceae bacterium JAD_PAG50586_4]